MTTIELIDILEELVDAGGDWDVKDSNGNIVTGAKITPRGVVVEVEE